MPFVIMRSEEFGEEEFEYETLKEAREGFKRLKKSSDEHSAADCIERELQLVVDRYVTTVDEDNVEPGDEDEEQDA